MLGVRFNTVLAVNVESGIRSAPGGRSGSCASWQVLNARLCGGMGHRLLYRVTFTAAD